MYGTKQVSIRDMRFLEFQAVVVILFFRFYVSLFRFGISQVLYVNSEKLNACVDYQGLKKLKLA